MARGESCPPQSLIVPEFVGGLFSEVFAVAVESRPKLREGHFQLGSLGRDGLGTQVLDAILD